MNYLAHIHLAHTTNTSLLGNFLGDFVKGSDLSHLPLDLQKGVRLHRSIDTFTDSHACVVSLRKGFPRNIRRMSGVVIDIYFDYLLSLNWAQYNNTDMTIMLAKFYEQLASTSLEIGGRFPEVKSGLLSYKWLHEYEQKETVIKAFKHIEKRLGYRITFANAAADFIEQYDAQLNQAFSQFYPQLMKYCKKLAN